MESGQQIRVSLLDFGGRGQSVTTEDIGVDKCPVQYGYILDKMAAVVKNTTICGRDVRQDRDGILFQSKGNAIEIVLSNQDSPMFLLGFTGCVKKLHRCNGSINNLWLFHYSECNIHCLVVHIPVECTNRISYTVQCQITEFSLISF